MENLYFVEHFVKDKAGWVRCVMVSLFLHIALVLMFVSSLILFCNILHSSHKESSMGKRVEIMGAEDMTIDKAMKQDEWGGHEVLFTVHNTEGTLTCCLWKTSSTMPLSEFQEFIDKFTGAFTTNKVYVVEGGLGLNLKKLDFRGYLRDFINTAQGRNSPGFLDASMLWMCHREFIYLLCIISTNAFATATLANIHPIVSFRSRHRCIQMGWSIRTFDQDHK